MTSFSKKKIIIIIINPKPYSVVILEPLMARHAALFV